MAQAIRVVGLVKARAQYKLAEVELAAALKVAAAKAVLFIADRAKLILQEEIYDKTRPEFAEPLTYELLNSFVVDVVKVGTQGVAGLLSNTSSHAPFIEFGTDDAGEGEHWVEPVNAPLLAWVDPQTGETRRSRGHFIHGIPPVRFMERSLTENTAEIIAIFRAEVAAAAQGLRS